MKSILHNKADGTCYLCMLLHDDYSRKMVREEHHVPFGRGIRPISERYGLKVYLCISHHRYEGGAEAVHRNNTIRRMLDRKAQEAFEKAYPDKNFREIFGKNYLKETDRQQDCRENESDISGFMLLENPIIGEIGW